MVDVVVLLFVCAVFPDIGSRLLLLLLLNRPDPVNVVSVINPLCHTRMQVDIVFSTLHHVNVVGSSSP